jgi:hypothetical protein
MALGGRVPHPGDDCPTAARASAFITDLALRLVIAPRPPLVDNPALDPPGS